MLDKNDCMSILVRLEDTGVDINEPIKKLLVSKEIPTEVLQFIIQNQGVEVVNFYEMLRKKHNQKKSPLYTNILKGTADPEQTLITLTCLLTQIALYSKKLTTDKELFLKEVRAKEIAQVLTEYFNTGEIEMVEKLLKVVKTDLLVLEYLNGRRTME